MLSKGQLRALRLLLESEDKEIVCEGIACMIGRERISRATVKALHYNMAIKIVDCGGVSYEIYMATESAPQILERPALADEMLARILKQEPFTVDSGGTIRDI